MTLRLGMVMDPVESITIYKDSSFAMCLAAQARGYQLDYLAPHELFVENSQAYAQARALSVRDDANDWFTLGDAKTTALRDYDIILMRKDPPFNIDYIYLTYLLELAENAGVLVANKPQSLRDANEKFFTTHFPECCPPTLVSASMERLYEFHQQHRDIIYKPLHGMGGRAIFRAGNNDPNVHVIIETLTNHGKHMIMAQQYIPEITTTGDKRILIVDGKPVPFALARIPALGETRGNLAAGARGECVPLTQRDHEICQQLAPVLQEMGLWFVGIDVIGAYLTEINVTSPTCIREIDTAQGLNIADDFLQALENKIKI